MFDRLPSPRQAIHADGWGSCNLEPRVEQITDVQWDEVEGVMYITWVGRPASGHQSNVMHCS